MIEREPAFKYLLNDALEKTRVFVENPVLMDIGANIGDYTVMMHKGMEGVPHTLIAVEPDPQMFSVLKSNMELHMINCICDGSAISDFDGGTRFYTAKKNNLGSLIYREGVNTEGPIVDCHTIQLLLHKYDLHNVNLIKMDIEGGEVLALRGGRLSLPYKKNIIILMEVHPHLYDGGLSLEDELKYLFSHGWKCLYGITSAIPEHFKGYLGTTQIKDFEVKPGWKRQIVRFNTPEDVIRYACHEDEIGIPTWHGTVGKKLMRALWLEK
jgi:FkbM family methyltransferase